MSCGQLGNVAAIVLVAATAGCDSSPEERPTIFLDPVASAPVPFSNRSDGTLVDDNVVCVTNSYEMRVECVGRDGSVVGVFGRKGEGPGEFPIAPGLVRGPGATIGAISRNRLTVFAPSGAMVAASPRHGAPSASASAGHSEVTLPVAFLQPAAPFEMTILGQHFGGGSEVTPIEIDVASGKTLWERPGLDTEVETECPGGVSLGVASPRGGWTFPACQRELVFFEGRDDPTPAIIQSPTYVEEFPNERDVAEIEFRNSRSAFRIDVNTYKETPKRNHLTVASLTYDDRGRLWVATERDRAHFSYFDIYVGIEYVGSVRVRDRLLAYDLYGSTLVTVVEREPDADGIGWRAADWYDIAGLNLGMR